MTLHPRALGGPGVAMRPGTMDFRTFRSTFVSQYHLPPSGDRRRIRRILDLGANVGFTAADLASRYPAATVIAVEMDPDNCRCAEKNTEAFGERVRCLNAAAWIDDRGVSYAPDADCDAYCVSDGDPGPGARTVPSMTIAQLIDLLPDRRADFVKMDVEGAETALLQPEDSGWLARVGALNVEVHDFGAAGELGDLLEDAGFVVRRSTRHWSALEAWRAS